MSKKYKSLPVHIVEYHNEALEQIYRAIGSKHLPTEGIVLLHFDAHPDMIIPDVRAEDVYKKNELFDALSIESWIMPALYAGHFEAVIWVKANWAEQLKDGRYDFKIGKHFQSSKIRVTCDDDYFLSECLYAPERELLDTKKVKFYVKTSIDEFSDIEKSDFREIFGDKPYILDIDLDFFSTKNPIKEMLSEKEYSSLKALYEFHPPLSRSENDLQNCTQNRGKVLSELKTMLMDIERRDFVKWGKNSTFLSLKSIYENVKQSKFGGEIDAELLHEFGCTCDDPELPYHVSGEAEIDELLVSMETHVKCIKRPPTLVTVSRSSIDDYCPPSQVEGIQKKVEESLQTLFKDVDIVYHYKKK